MNRWQAVRQAGAVGAVALAVAFGAASAEAATSVWVRDGNGGTVFNGGPGYVTINIRVVKPDNSVWSPGVNAGAFALQYSLTSNGGPWTDFLTYCLEPDETLGINSNGTAYQGTLGASVGNTPDYAASGAQLRALYNNFFADSLTSATKSAAFQVALWEVAYETKASYTLGDILIGNANIPTSAGLFGVFDTNGSAPGSPGDIVAAQAMQYLSLFNGNWAAGQDIGVILRVGNQDLVVRLIPEPATAGLLGAGLVGLALSTRRRRRQA
jgi:hypothetical protein